MRSFLFLLCSSISMQMRPLKALNDEIQRKIRQTTNFIKSYINPLMKT